MNHNNFNKTHTKKRTKEILSGQKDKNKWSEEIEEESLEVVSV